MADSLLHCWDKAVWENKTSLALVCTDGTFTFEELDRKCDDFASFLTHQGIQVNDIVAIVTDVSPELVWAILASIKIGAVYMHVDKGYPPKLIEEIMDCVKPKVILQNGGSLSVGNWRRSGQYDSLTLLHPSESEQKLTSSENHNNAIPKTSQNSRDPQHMEQSSPGNQKIAYIALTSGSTGCPKAIRGTERSLVHSIHQFLRVYPFSESDNREACYVAFIWEFLRPLFSGCSLYIIPSHIITCGNNLAEFLARHGITRIFITSSVLEILLNEGRNLKHLKTIILCGEPVSVALLERALRILPGVRFVNLYGICEAADVASVDLGSWYQSAEDINEYENCPVGEAIPGVKISVLDDAMNPSKLGQSGEIFIAGETLADGYIGLPEQTSRNFLRHPKLLSRLGLHSGPVYKSGDRGRWHKNGYLEVMGRKEKSEVLVRGQKVNLKVTEKSILAIPGVQSCVISFQDGDLVGIVVSTLPSEYIHKHLLSHLPQAFVPSMIKCCTQLPINAQTGKVDVKALTVDEKQEFQTETEKMLAAIWAATLGHTCFDRTSNFFQVGGHSLLVGKLLAKINFVFKMEICPEHLFEHCKLTEMAEMIDKRDFDVKFNLDEEWRSIKETWVESVRKAGTRVNVLLTGATGYLGSYILHQLLAQTNMNVLCLLRVRTQKTNAKCHLYQVLQERNLDSKDMKDQFEARVTVLESDLSRTNFNLTDEAYRSLLHQTDVVIHCAASVNMIYPYQALKQDNIEATANILHFCLASHPHKELHYISSVSVLDANSDLISSSTVPPSGYTQSKLLAEKLVLHVRNTSALLLTIYRPSYLSPDPSNVTWNQNDAVFQFLQQCVRKKQLPNDLHLDLTPVTFTAEFIVKGILQHTGATGGTYNLSNPEWATVRCADLTRAGIPDVESVTWEAWKDPEDFLGSGIHDPQRYDTTATERKLLEWGMLYPKITEHVLAKYLKSLV